MPFDEIDENPPILTVFYNDTSIVLRTRGGAEVAMPAADALALAAALTKAVQDLQAHQQMIADIDDIGG